MVLASVNGEAIAIGGAAALAAMSYAVFSLTKNWSSYGRWWERIAASFLTLFILATLLGIGVVVGLAIVWAFATNS